MANTTKFNTHRLIFSTTTKSIYLCDKQGNVIAHKPAKSITVERGKGFSKLTSGNGNSLPFRNWPHSKTGYYRTVSPEEVVLWKSRLS